MIHLEISVSDGRKFNRKFSHQSFEAADGYIWLFLGLRNSEIIRIGWMEAPRVFGHSFFKGPAVTWFFSWPQLYFHKAPCVNAPSPGRLPHLVDVNAQGRLFASSISESCNWPPTSCISGSVEAFSSALCIYICSALFLFTSRVTVHNLQTPELL